MYNNLDFVLEVGLSLLVVLTSILIIGVVGNIADMVEHIMDRLDIITESCNISYPEYTLIPDMEIEDPNYKDWDMVYEVNSMNIYYMLVTDNKIFMKPRLLEDGSHEKCPIR